MYTTSITGAVLLLALFAVAPGTPAAETWTGDAYDLGSGALRYRESHYLSANDGAQHRVVLYSCPDGRPFARKQIRDDGDPQAPDFDMLDARLGYREGVRRNSGKRDVYVQRTPDLSEKTEPLNLPNDGVIDAGFDAYVHKHWDALARGGSLSLPFLVPSKRMFYTFKLAKVENASNAATLSLRLSLGAWYAFLAPHIDVTYDRNTQRLLRFEGMSNIRDEALKNYNVRIEFPKAPATLTADQLAAALAVPLVTVCADVRADTATSATTH
jgi:hypothetical protein